MNCPTCQHGKSMVLRTEGDTHTVMRQRQCCACGWRWSTVEAKSEEFQRLQRLLEIGRAIRRELPDAGQGD
jgi:transcriptional regulator NrdR family protein